MLLFESLLDYCAKRKKENFPYFRNKKGLKTLYQTYGSYMCKGNHFNTIRTPLKKFVPLCIFFVPPSKCSYPSKKVRTTYY